MKHSITNLTLAQLELTMRKQDQKGLKKYHTPLNPKDNYNWLQMAEEELADLVKYLMCEQLEKQRVIQILQENKENAVQEALAILTKGE